MLREIAFEDFIAIAGAELLDRKKRKEQAGLRNHLSTHFDMAVGGGVALFCCDAPFRRNGARCHPSLVHVAMHQICWKALN